MGRYVWVECLVLALALVPAARACSYAQAGDAEQEGVVWGGTDVQMVMMAQGATLEFDCAHGAIVQAVKPDARGQFSAAGTFTPERGGPVMKDNPPRDLPAVYKGTVDGDTMRLQVVLDDKAQQPPQFTLTRGQQGRVRKCR